MTRVTAVRRASRRIHVLLGMALAGCLMNPLLEAQTALLMARVIVVLAATFGWLIPGSWKRFVHRRPRRDTAPTVRPGTRPKERLDAH